MHLRNADRIPFTLGVSKAGDLHLRNDAQGDNDHLPSSSTADLTTIGQTTADVISALY
ncbi:hypothetical protein ACFV2N_47570 [Streptomyces sp. NPDC059680]|uniref:hypothetical protein n=1 Tax=Streptomyces sp. NPDC059680 TaxID=3346904 RepID=UPI0036936F2B